jgi:DNA modification methylase
MLANGYRGKVDLIYADPPFNTGVDNYVRNVRLRKMKIAGIDGEPISFMEQIQYENYYFPDIYLQFLFDRLKLMYELLSESGNLFLRMDHHYNHMARCILDEVFGVSGYKNEIAVSRTRTLKGEEGRFHAATESVYFYAKSSDSTFNGYHISIPKEQWQWLEMHMTGERKNKDLLTIEVMGRKFKAPNGRRWVLSQSSIDDAVKKGLVKIDEEKNRPLFLNKHYSPGSNWTDIPGYSKKFNYPTENSEELLERVIISASNPGDIVLDCFVGSGTTAAVAQKLGRRWIGCDINKGSIQTTSKRLQKIILDQIEEQDKKSKRPKLIEDEEEIKPASLAFSVCRVNDYDLQIQHNEAVNLACEHIGIERKKTDTFFDGTFGKNLVKIIPFNHPLSPVDLEEIKKELEARPDEERAITVVCLGIELAAKAWVEEWNRLRKGHNAVNKIDVIELRSDAKYGGFIKHEPAKAKINFARKKDAVAIEI